MNQGDFDLQSFFVDFASETRERFARLEEGQRYILNLLDTLNGKVADHEKRFLEFSKTSIQQQEHVNTLEKSQEEITHSLTAVAARTTFLENKISNNEGVLCGAKFTGKVLWILAAPVIGIIAVALFRSILPHLSIVK